MTRLIRIVMAAALCGCAASPAPQAAAPAPARIDSATFTTLWRQGQTWPQFRDAIDARPQMWARTQSLVAIPDAVVQRARNAGSWKLMIVADDDCSDSGNVIPYLARLSELAPNLELRIVPDELGTRVKETHRTPDGRTAIPTLVVLDAGFNDRGCWVERPAQLQHWFMTRGSVLLDTDTDTYRREKQGWYDFDHGASTLDEVLSVVEAAGTSRPRCGITPHAF
jgi:hypothetical protein